MIDDLPFDYGTEERPALAKPRTCRHPREMRRFEENGDAVCTRCGRTIAHVTRLRGRRSRNRGNAIEREVAARLGLKRVGQYGGPDDGRGEWLVVQVKSGGSFPERIWKWLHAMTADANQTRAVVLTDAPGPGHKRRALVVTTLEDWEGLHRNSV